MKLTQRMTKATARGVIAVAGLALLLGAQSALANPITSFNYETHLTFTSWTSTNGDSSGISTNNSFGGDLSAITPPQGSAVTQLKWGVPSNSSGHNPGLEQSALDITVPNLSGTVTVGDSTPSPDGTLRHDNNVITDSSASLTNAIITGWFKLTANPSPPLGSTPWISTPFQISFAETPNVSGTCVAPSPAGNPCNDIFALANPAVIDAYFLGSAFGGDGSYQYHLHLGFINGTVFEDLPQLTAGECAAVNLASGCVGFTTVEDDDTPKSFGFIITSEHLTRVPEPMPIALFGLGLLALGVMIRRRRRSDHAN